MARGAEVLNGLQLCARRSAVLGPKLDREHLAALDRDHVGQAWASQDKRASRPSPLLRLGFDLDAMVEMYSRACQRLPDEAQLLRSVGHGFLLALHCFSRLAR
jgi:hypothetical protein